MTASEPIPAFIADKNQYKSALKRVRDDGKLTENMLAMLRCQLHAPQRSVTATELAGSMGYPSHEPANRQYGELGRLLAEALHHVPSKRADGTFRYWSTLSTGDPDFEHGEQFRFVMRTELADALTEMRWC